MSSVNAYEMYLKQEVEGASQGKLIVMMYDAAIRFMQTSVKAMNEKNIQDAHNNLIRAQNILYELMATLNTEEGGEIAKSLLYLYDYMIWELIDANSSKNAEKVENVIKIITPLRGAWKEVFQKEKALMNGKKDEGTKSINFSG